MHANVRADLALHWIESFRVLTQKIGHGPEIDGAFAGLEPVERHFSSLEGADCAVPALPDAGSLPTEAKLPDPFQRLNGTRITTVADWQCRRAEIKKLVRVHQNPLLLNRTSV